MTIVDSSTADTSASIGDIVTSGGSNNTKGSWTEAIASTSEETYWLTIVFKGAVNDVNFLVDIGVGAAASEVVQIANIPFFANTSTVSGVMATPPMPITIASSARVAVRCQSNPGGGTQALQFMLYLSNDDSLGTSTSNETWGDQTGTSQGTDVDPGGTDNTKGSYSELIASSGIAADYLVVFGGNSSNNGQVAQRYLFDVATGAASSEVDDIPNIPFFSHNLELVSTAYSFFHSVSSSTRVSARCQSDAAAAAGTNDRLIDVAIIAFVITPPAGGGGGGGIKLVGNGGGLVG